MGYFPFFVDIAGRKCLIAGGGKIAYRKAVTVLEYGAKVLVVAPKICKEFDILKKTYGSAIETEQREFNETDTEGMFFVIAATDDESINKRVSEICFEKNILVNTVDRKEYCNFYFPSIIKDGDIVVGVSSGGNSPVLARELRKKIEAVIPENLDKINKWLGKLRPYIKENIEDEKKRKKCFERIYEECEKKGDILTEEEVERIKG